MKIEFFDTETGEVQTNDDYFVMGGIVYCDNYQSCESQAASVSFQDFIREVQGVGWRVVDPTVWNSAIDAAVKLCEDVDEPRWYGYENPNTFTDGVVAYADAIKALVKEEPVVIPKMAVWFDSMPESNGKTNWTVILHREDQSVSEGVTIERTEYYDRARYEADRMRFLIGEISKAPFILDYDENLKTRPEAKEGA